MSTICLADVIVDIAFRSCGSFLEPAPGGLFYFANGQRRGPLPRDSPVRGWQAPNILTLDDTNQSPSPRASPSTGEAGRAERGSGKGVISGWQSFSAEALRSRGRRFPPILTFPRRGGRDPKGDFRIAVRFRGGSAVNRSQHPPHPDPSFVWLWRILVLPAKTMRSYG